MLLISLCFMSNHFAHNIVHYFQHIRAIHTMHRHAHTYCRANGLHRRCRSRLQMNVSMHSIGICSSSLFHWVPLQWTCAHARVVWTAVNWTHDSFSEESTWKAYRLTNFKFESFINLILCRVRHFCAAYPNGIVNESIGHIVYTSDLNILYSYCFFSNLT